MFLGVKDYFDCTTDRILAGEGRKYLSFLHLLQSLLQSTLGSIIMLKEHLDLARSVEFPFMVS